MRLSCLRWMLVALAACSASASDCPEFSDAQQLHCCQAEEAFDAIEELGGCGGNGASRHQCSEAGWLCQICKNLSTSISRNATELEGQSLASLEISSLEMQCELPQWNIECPEFAKYLSTPVFVVTGLILLLVAIAGLIMFDWRFLPRVVAWHRRHLLMQTIEEDSARAREDGPTTEDAAVPLPPVPVPLAPPTPSAKPPCSSEDSLRLAANLEDMRDSEFEGVSESKPVTGLPAARWSRRLASAWAIHKGFMLVASGAVLLRVAYLVARAILMQSPPHEYVLPLLFCMLPLAWCLQTTRPKSLTAVPTEIAYWGPRRLLPRFTTYAFLTVFTELYIIMMHALAVSSASCQEPLRQIIFYCMGLVVAVARVYSAVLALRLQDEFSALCKKIGQNDTDEREIEDVEFTLDGEAAVGVADGLDMSKVDREQSLPYLQTSPQQLALEERKLNPVIVAVKGIRDKMSSLVLTPLSKDSDDAVRGFDDPNPDEAPLTCAFLPEFCCPVLRRRVGFGRRLLAIGIILVLLSAGASAVAILTSRQSQHQTEHLDACAVAQNSTTTCVAYETLQDMPEQMEAAVTMGDCCASCDASKDCQAWIFEYYSKQCRLIRFLDEVCHTNPEDLSCRCFTGSGRAFGFKAASKKVYLHKAS